MFRHLYGVTTPRSGFLLRLRFERTFSQMRFHWAWNIVDTNGWPLLWCNPRLLTMTNGNIQDMGPPHSLKELPWSLRSTASPSYLGRLWARCPIRIQNLRIAQKIRQVNVATRRIRSLFQTVAKISTISFDSWWDRRCKRASPAPVMVSIFPLPSFKRTLNDHDIFWDGRLKYFFSANVLRLVILTRDGWSSN